LEGHKSSIRKIDAIMLSFFMGASLFMLPLVVFFVVTESSTPDGEVDNKNVENETLCWINNFPVFRLTFAVI
jgi:hypothetical protein